MKKVAIIMGLAVVTVWLSSPNQAEAQRLRGRRSNVIYSGTDADGMTMTDFRGLIGPQATLRMAARNPFSPAPVYTYSNQGILAQRTHIWNQNESLSRPWHGDFNHWRWREPTALVVPPTASNQSSYAWGVGQVRSTPIHHQFGRGGGGTISGGGMFSDAPYSPSSTNQFGVYPVRAPW